MRKELWLALVLAFYALSSTAADNVIYKGIDAFRTPNDGSSYMDFSKQPIPADFFCTGSKPFTGKIHWRGVPVATGLPGELRQTDTIVQRLDDAAFNKNGIARTRIQVRALQLESMKPVKTSCGSYNVRVVLDGPQPITSMKIARLSEYGGRFTAYLTIRAKFVFTPVSAIGRQLELPPHEIRFPANPRFSWVFRSNLKQAPERKGAVLVDTNFDSLPDAFLPGTSNFVAGGALNNQVLPPGCHEHLDGCVHCIEPY